MTAGNPQDGENVEEGGNAIKHLERPDPSTDAAQDGNCMGVPVDRVHLLGANGDDCGGGMSNPMDASDADEHDVGGTAAANHDELPLRPLPRQARRQANRQ